MNQMNTVVCHSPTHEEIALHAFLLWEREGRPDGRSMNYWLEAEAQLRQTREHQVRLATDEAARPWPPTSVEPKLARALAATAAKPARPVRKAGPTRSARSSGRRVSVLA